MLREAKSAGFQYLKGFAFLPDIGASSIPRYPRIPVPWSQAAAVLQSQIQQGRRQRTHVQKWSLRYWLQTSCPSFLCSTALKQTSLLSRYTCHSAVPLLLCSSWSWSSEMRSAVSLGHLYIPCIIICSQELYSNCSISPISNEPYTVCCSLSVDIYPAGIGGS